jgi:hypothetical protein
MYAFSNVVFYFKIEVLDEKRNKIEVLIWEDLVWDIRLKYDWYFKYRAALLQVKHPKYKVEVFHGRQDAKGKTLSNILKDKIRSKKAKITEYNNKLNLAIKEWNSLFPIEDDADFQRAKSKIWRLENELIDLENYKNEVDKNQ